eukprot:380280-Amphidinium_carterae.1
MSSVLVAAPPTPHNHSVVCLRFVSANSSLGAVLDVALNSPPAVRHPCKASGQRKHVLMNVYEWACGRDCNDYLISESYHEDIYLCNCIWNIIKFQVCIPGHSIVCSCYMANPVEKVQTICYYLIDQFFSTCPL